MTDAVSNSTNTTATSSTSTTSSSKELASNFQTFLTLLTTQLQNQDPTSPMDSNEFTQQLVMYSQVEQQIDTNSKLDSLISLSGSQTSNLAMSYMGKNVVLSDGTGQLYSGSAEWSYGLANGATAATLTVKDSDGNVVYSKNADSDGKTAGVHTFDWDGTTNSGDTAADGLYTLTISATAADGTSIKTTIASKVGVTGVDLSGSTPQLIVGTGEVPLSSVSLVTMPVSSSDSSSSDSSSSDSSSSDSSSNDSSNNDSSSTN
jgi:flagellar basal-body rod modification protein FlgD